MKLMGMPKPVAHARAPSTRWTPAPSAASWAASLEAYISYPADPQAQSADGSHAPAILPRQPTELAYLWRSRGSCPMLSHLTPQATHAGSARTKAPGSSSGASSPRVRTSTHGAAVRNPNRADLLSSILASRALARLIIHFAARPDERARVRALQRHTGLTPRSLQMELTRLERLGVIERSTDGDQVTYALNEDNPRWRVLQQLARKLGAPVDVIQDVLSDLPGMVAAFVFGSFARGDVREDSDIDVFILGEDIPEDRLTRPRSTLACSREGGQRHANEPRRPPASAAYRERLSPAHVGRAESGGW